MTHRLPVMRSLVFTASAVAAVAQMFSVPYGTRVSGGEVWLPCGLKVSLAHVSAEGSSLETVTGRPYSARQVMESSRSLPDGTKRNHVSQKATLYRDTEGRIRTESTVFPPEYGAFADALPTFIEIIDPVAGFRYRLDPRKKTVRTEAWPVSQQTTMPQEGLSEPTSQTSISSSATTVSAQTLPGKNSSLGTLVIEGLTTLGTKNEWTFDPKVTKTEKPITQITENWVCLELKLILLTKSYDPRYGESVVRLTDIQQTEPDPSLFQVPSGYTPMSQ
jgi:hypothetical protein